MKKTLEQAFASGDADSVWEAAVVVLEKFAAAFCVPYGVKIAGVAPGDREVYAEDGRGQMFRVKFGVTQDRVAFEPTEQWQGIEIEFRPTESKATASRPLEKMTYSDSDSDDESLPGNVRVVDDAYSPGGRKRAVPALERLPGGFDPYSPDAKRGDK